MNASKSISLSNLLPPGRKWLRKFPNASQRPQTKLMLALAITAGCSTVMTRAADLSWSGGTGSYNNAAAWGGRVPGSGDNAINDSGSTNVVQINVGDPDWSVIDFRAGNG